MDKKTNRVLKKFFNLKAKQMLCRLYLNSKLFETCKNKSKVEKAYEKIDMKLYIFIKAHINTLSQFDLEKEAENYQMTIKEQIKFSKRYFGGKYDINNLLEAIEI